MLRRSRLAALLAALSTLGPFSIDTYLPAFPAVAQGLGVGLVDVQLTLTAYFAAFGFMMLFHGALSDAYGRRPVLIVAMCVYCVASIGCALSTTLAQLIAFRVLQGACGGAGMVVGRAIIRDTFPGHEAQRVMSLVTMIFAIAPAIAPIIGGWLHYWFPWQSIFWFLAAFSALLVTLATSLLPETHPQHARHPFRPAPLGRAYAKVAGNGRFLLLGLVLAFNFAGFFVYIMAAPAFGYDMLKLEKTQFAWLFVPGVLGMIAGSFTSGRLAGKTTPVRTATLGYAVMALAAVVNLGYHALWPPALPWSVVPMMIYTYGLSLTMPSVTILALDLFPANRGLASSLLGFVQSSSNALLAGVIAPFLAVSALTLAYGMAGILFAGACCWLAYCRVR